MMGIPDRFLDHGTQEELHLEAGIDVDSIKKQINKLLYAI
jgi:deoxyxylulose-5-phosphate synthase